MLCYYNHFFPILSSKDSLAPALPKPKTARDASYNALKFYSAIQGEDGHWAGDYGGPLFLMPGMPIFSTPYCVRTAETFTVDYVVCVVLR